MKFFLSQLDYDSEAGRLSAVEFLVSVFNSFPKNFLSQEGSFFMVMMSPYLINETSSACVKAIAGAIRFLIEKLNTQTATTLFDVSCSCFNLQRHSFYYLSILDCIYLVERK